MRHRPGYLARLGLLAVLASAAGCSEELGPERMKTTRVSGSLTIAGRPITSGWVEFLPAEGTVGNLRVAPIGADGSFSADRVPVGVVAIALGNVTGRPVATEYGDVPLATFRLFSTPIRRAIPEGDSTRLDLDLAPEARDYLKARLALRRAMGE